MSRDSLYSKIRSYMNVASNRAVCLIYDLINRKYTFSNSVDVDQTTSGQSRLNPIHTVGLWVKKSVSICLHKIIDASDSNRCM